MGLYYKTNSYKQLKTIKTGRKYSPMMIAFIGYLIRSGQY